MRLSPDFPPRYREEGQGSARKGAMKYV